MKPSGLHVVRSLTTHTHTQTHTRQYFVGSVGYISMSFCLWRKLSELQSLQFPLLHTGNRPVQPAGLRWGRKSQRETLNSSSLIGSRRCRGSDDLYMIAGSKWLPGGWLGSDLCCSLSVQREDAIRHYLFQQQWVERSEWGRGGSGIDKQLNTNWTASCLKNPLIVYF